MCPTCHLLVPDPHNDIPFASKPKSINIYGMDCSEIQIWNLRSSFDFVFWLELWLKNHIFWKLLIHYPFCTFADLVLNLGPIHYEATILTTDYCPDIHISPILVEQTL